MTASGSASAVHLSAPAVKPDPPYATAAFRRWRRATDIPLLILAIGSLPVLALELLRADLPRSDRVFLDVVNLVVLAAFALDYVVELVTARPRSQFVRHEWTSLVIVLAQAAAVLPGLAGFGVLRVLRGARVFRAAAVLGRLFAIGGSAAKEGRRALRQRAASLALGLAAFTWLTSAVAFTIAEGVDADSGVHSFFDSLWWSITTMATVGYGDIFPRTGVGRLIAGITMIVGIATFAVVTAKVAEFLVRADAEDRDTAVTSADESDLSD